MIYETEPNERGCGGAAARRAGQMMSQRVNWEGHREASTAPASGFRLVALSLSVSLHRAPAVLGTRWMWIIFFPFALHVEQCQVPGATSHVAPACIMGWLACGQWPIAYALWAELASLAIQTCTTTQIYCTAT